VKALGRDRVVSLRFGAGPGTFNLFLELYAAGNVVLCDASYVVVAALRTDSLKVGDSYNVAVRAVAPVSELLAANELQKFLEDALRTRVQRSEAAAWRPARESTRGGLRFMRRGDGVPVG